MKLIQQAMVAAALLTSPSVAMADCYMSDGAGGLMGTGRNIDSGC